MRNILTVALFTMLFSIGSTMAEQRFNPTMPMTGIALNGDSIRALSNEGLSGSPDSAQKLALHFLVANGNLTDGMYWTHIAAENGHAVAQYNMWQLLNQSEDANNHKRALFWLRRSAASGNSDAIEKLKELQLK